MIESKQNQRVKAWKKLSQKKHRDREGLFLVEGWHLVEEAVKSDWTIDTLIVEDGVEVTDEWSTLPLEFVSSPVMKEISQTETPQGIAAVVRQKEWELNQPKRMLMLDQIQDPGNVGTIIRSGLAFGVEAIILGKGTVDLYNEKVVRATQGALFHFPVIQSDLFEWLNKRDIVVYGTALDEQAKALPEIEPPEAFAIILGNEGMGVQPSLLERCNETIYIPQETQAESLNVGIAASVILYHFRYVT